MDSTEILIFCANEPEVLGVIPCLKTMAGNDKNATHEILLNSSFANILLMLHIMEGEIDIITGMLICDRSFYWKVDIYNLGRSDIILHGLRCHGLT